MTDPYSKGGEPTALQAAAEALDDKLARWVDRHWMNEYPFQAEWLALHEALYGHERTKVLSPCTGDHAARVSK